MNRKYSFIFAFLITGLIACNVYLFSSFSHQSSRETALVARVIDGDTLVLDDGRTIRLLNINTPEKSEPNSNLGTEFLKSLENESIQLETTGIDKYGRTLARLYNSSDYFNLKLVSLGYAVKFLVSESELNEFSSAEENAIENSLGIWHKSEYYGCFKANIDEKKEIAFLINSCSDINMLGWKIRDESRKYYIFGNVVLGKINFHSSNGEDNETDIFWNQKTDVWNNDRDTLYLLDPEGSIAFYHPYGY